MTLLERLRANPGLPIGCYWIANPHDRDHRHSLGGWGFKGCGPAIATTAEVRALYEQGLLRCVNPWQTNAELQKLEWMDFMLAGET